MSEHQSYVSVEMSSEKSFGVVFATIFIVVGLLPLIEGNPPRYWASFLSIMFLILAFLAPQTLKIL